MFDEQEKDEFEVSNNFIQRKKEKVLTFGVQKSQRSRNTLSRPEIKDNEDNDNSPKRVQETDEIFDSQTEEICVSQLGKTNGTNLLSFRDKSPSNKKSNYEINNWIMPSGNSKI